MDTSIAELDGTPQQFILFSTAMHPEKLSVAGSVVCSLAIKYENRHIVTIN